MKLKIKILALILVYSYSAYTQKVSFESTNQKIKVELFSGDNIQTGKWFLKKNSIIIGENQSDNITNYDQYIFLKLELPKI